jgi:DNA-binding transcriptional LysR family regulator
VKTMTLDQLRVFVAVAELEHLTRAANALALSQSAVSSSVAALEARYDTKLFDRIGRNIALTAAGRLFLDEARAVLARASAAQRAMADLTGLRRGTVSLAASQTVGNYWLPGVMRRFRAQYPGISLALSITNTEQVVRQVGDGTADLGFVEDQVVSNGLDAHAVATDELMLVVAPNHPWAARPDFVPEGSNLRESPWVLRERGSGTRRLFEQAVRDLQLDPRALDVALELPSNEAVRTAVEAGAGATVMSKLVVASSIRAGTLVGLRWSLPAREFLMLGHQQRFASEAMRAFCEMAST